MQFVVIAWDGTDPEALGRRSVVRPTHLQEIRPARRRASRAARRANYPGERAVRVRCGCASTPGKRQRREVKAKQRQAKDERRTSRTQRRTIQTPPLIARWNGFPVYDEDGHPVYVEPEPATSHKVPGRAKRSRVRPRLPNRRRSEGIRQAQQGRSRCRRLLRKRLDLSSVSFVVVGATRNPAIPIGP